MSLMTTHAPAEPARAAHADPAHEDPVHEDMAYEDTAYEVSAYEAFVGAPVQVFPGVTGTTGTTPARFAPSASTPASARRGFSLLVVPDGRQGTLSRSAVRRRRGLPCPASATPSSLTPAPPATPHSTPVPLLAHPTPRAIRVRRSPR